jgi:hypothetical protein
VRRKLASADDGNRQMVDILTAVLTDGLPAVEAACAEAIAHSVHSADVVLNTFPWISAFGCCKQSEASAPKYRSRMEG